MNIQRQGQSLSAGPRGAGRRWVAVAGLALLCALGAGCGQIPSDRSIHRLARKAALAQPGLPAGAKVSGLKDSVVSVGKNAARVDLSVQADGMAPVDQTVWFFRVARTWTVQKITPPLAPATK